MDPSLQNLPAIHQAGLHVVAWQGVRMVLPVDWEPGALSGDWGGGHIRIDERMEPRLVIRWLPEESTKSLFRRTESHAAAIEEIADNYLDGLARERKKKRKTVEHRKTERLLARRKLNISPITCFEWSCEQDGVVAVGFTGECPDSGRVVISELTGRSIDEVRSRAEALFPDLRLRPESDDAVLWSAFGLRVSLPNTWKLSGNSLVGGKIELRFAADGGQQLCVQRWIANLALGRGDLVEWAKKQLAKDLRGEFLFRMERGKCHGHEAVLAEGSKRAVKDRITYAAKRLVKQDTRVHMLCRAWHCEQENKIYVVRTVGLDSEAAFADEAAARLLCHIGGS
jgi:hypothetical protein